MWPLARQVIIFGMPVLDALRVPIVQAPMAGGPSTPALAAAVSAAGGLGMLAAGYKAPDAVRADLEACGDARVGLNLFAPVPGPADPDAVERYAAMLRAAGHELGEPRFDDDAFAAKVALAAEARVPVVSFAFGLPGGDAAERLRAAGGEIWVTVTTPEEALTAEEAGADVLVVQGIEAGGHRGSFLAGEGFGLLALLQLVAARTALPLVASGGVMTGAAIAAVLAAGARAAQLGSAFLLADEAGTTPAQREATATDRPTRLTRAFSGRLARGIVNRFMDDHDADAPDAYPEVHHLTSPLRADARRRGDADRFNLWAGQAHALAHAGPAAEIVERLAAELSGSTRG